MKSKTKSIIDGDTEFSCYLCGRTGRLIVHHAMHGTANRKIADKYGLTVHLCPECHRKLHDQNVENVLVEQAAERSFSRRYGHEKWMELFGKSFLCDAEEISEFDNVEDAVEYVGYLQWLNGEWPDEN